ncbi:MAG: hypothetical protein ACOYNO_02100 [Saprospiraceae bacterium]
MGFLLCAQLTTTAQTAGQPDPTFGLNGAALLNYPSYVQTTPLAIQPDQKIVVGHGIEAGNENLTAVARFEADGKPDTLFGTNGIVTLALNEYEYNDIYKTLPLSNGKLLLSINSYGDTDDLTRIVRLNNNGALDSTFGVNGIVKLSLSASDLEEYLLDAVELTDGKYLFVGVTYNSLDLSRSIVVRMNEDGTLDNTFDNDGILQLNPGVGNHYVTAIDQSPDGKWLLAGYYQKLQGIDIYVARLNPSGTLDLSFGQNGIAKPGSLNDDAYVWDIEVLPNGSFYTVGSLSDDNFVLSGLVSRFNADGSFDVTFGQNGATVVDFGDEEEVRSCAVQSDGKILLSGYRVEDNMDYKSQYFVGRLNIDGSIDVAFANQGVLFGDVAKDAVADGLAIQPDGKILVGGHEAAPDGPSNDVFVRRYFSGTVGAFQATSVVLTAELFPNPATDATHLRFSIKEPTRFAVQLLNAEGKVCATLQTERNWPAGEHLLPMNLPSNLPKGQYQVVLFGQSTAQAMPLQVK